MSLITEEVLSLRGLWPCRRLWDANGRRLGGPPNLVQQYDPATGEVWYWRRGREKGKDYLGRFERLVHPAPLRHLCGPLLFGQEFIGDFPEDAA